MSTSFSSAAQCDQTKGDFCTSVMLDHGCCMACTEMVSTVEVELGLLGDFENVTTSSLGAILRNSHLPQKLNYH